MSLYESETRAENDVLCRYLNANVQKSYTFRFLGRLHKRLKAGGKLSELGWL